MDLNGLYVAAVNQWFPYNLTGGKILINTFALMSIFRYIQSSLYHDMQYSQKKLNLLGSLKIHSKLKIFFFHKHVILEMFNNVFKSSSCIMGVLAKFQREGWLVEWDIWKNFTKSSQLFKTFILYAGNKENL